MEGGADTTSFFLRTLILLLVAFPNAQKKAQIEIDTVIGMKRAPVLQDFGNLPYVQALVKEVSMWIRRMAANFVLIFLRFCAFAQSGR